MTISAPWRPRTRWNGSISRTVASAASVGHERWKPFSWNSLVGCKKLLFQGSVELLLWSRLVTPRPTEQMSPVLGYHRRNAHNTHDQEDDEEDYCNDQYRHAAPLGALCCVLARSSVMRITGRCEAWRGFAEEIECAGWLEGIEIPGSGETQERDNLSSERRSAPQDR